MAWTYADFETYTDPAAKLTRLRAHIAEVEAAVDSDVTRAGGDALGNDPLNTKLDRLYKRLREIEATAPGSRTGDVRASAGFVRGRCL